MSSTDSTFTQMARTRKSKSSAQQHIVAGKISQAKRRPSSPSLSPPPPPPKRKHSKNHDGRIPRPPNAFVLYRSFYISNYAGPITQQNQLSKQAGEVWKGLSDDDPTKRKFRSEAQVVKAQHALKNPEWRYNNPAPRATSSASDDDEPSPRPRSATKRRIRKKEEQSPRVVPQALPRPVLTLHLSPYMPRAAAMKASQKLKRLAKEEARKRSPSPAFTFPPRLASPKQSTTRDPSPGSCDEFLATPPPPSPSMSSSSSKESIEATTPPTAQTSVDCSMDVDFDWEQVQAAHGTFGFLDVPFLLDVDSLVASELLEEPQAGFEVKNPATMWSAPDAPLLRSASPDVFLHSSLGLSFGSDDVVGLYDDSLDPLHLDLGADMFEGDNLFGQHILSL